MAIIVTLVILVAVMAGAGFFVTSREQPAAVVNAIPIEEAVVEEEENSIVFPIEGYAVRRTFNGFGEYSQGSLTGYHVGDDIEYTDKLADSIPVVSIAQGTVARLENVAGYGGMILVTHVINGKELNAIYGHIDLGSVVVVVGE